jgi:hypothetical protein
MNNKKKTLRDILYYDKVYNNPRSDRQDDGMDDAEEEKIKNRMLFDEKQRSSDLVKRMIKSYNKNRSKINNKPEQPPISQSEKRRRKLIDLVSRSSSWKGLENYNMNEDANDFTREFRKLYYSSRTMTFRKWLEQIENLLDTI